MAPTLVFVDMLGVKSAWRDGQGAVRERLAVFESLLGDTLNDGCGSIIAGGIETDAAAFIFNDSQQALAFGERLFRRAFATAERPPAHSVWLRAVIVKGNDQNELRRVVPWRLSGIDKTTYAAELFLAVNVEKSGFKGMRLLVDSELATEELVNLTALQVGSARMNRLRKLRWSPYPAASPVSCVDFLWCLSGEPTEEASLNNVMQRRLRRSASDHSEFEQAAATQVLFHETYSLLHAVRIEGGIRPPNNPYYYDPP